MLEKNIKISDLQVILDHKFGKGAWLNWEPETILLEFACPEFLVAEKIYVLQGLNKALNSIISLPEFLLWTTSVCNNEYAEFETLSIPTALELAWALEEIKKVALLTGQVFSPSEELKDVVAYLLRHEGFSCPLAPFEFVPEARLEAGQTESDTRMKAAAIYAYLKHMRGEIHA